ncbi:prepilin-type N-terminal cleavage/methylation domain-containing protein [Ancylobacter sonchi]|nr:prepilin-type N-terminal cleavage/methylation domain-containing protein [Ancylobacter sonchi]
MNFLKRFDFAKLYFMKHGFSLVELSIVLVILGLLTGGILAGQSLIRAAEVRSISTDISRYHTAVMTFQDRYLGIPGDITHATKFWGAADGGDGLGSDCFDVVGVGTATCNGDGDGMLGGSTIPQFSERHRFWRHLANANLIEGTYSGVAGPVGPGDVVLGVNAPYSRIPNAGYAVGYETVSNSANSFPNIVVNANVLTFGRDDPSMTFYPVYGAINPVELWGIDNKLDDGKPASGRIYTHKKSSPITPNCTTTDDRTSEYNVAETSALCSFRLLLSGTVRL